MACIGSFFFFQAEDGIRDGTVTGVQTCALPISQLPPPAQPAGDGPGGGPAHPSPAAPAAADVWRDCRAGGRESGDGRAHRAALWLGAPARAGAAADLAALRAGPSRRAAAPGHEEA